MQSRIGLETGPLSQWLLPNQAYLPVFCVETRHMREVSKAQLNKTDRNGACGIAQVIRVGLYPPGAHVKTLRSQKLSMLSHRKLLQINAVTHNTAPTRRCRRVAVTCYSTFVSIARSNGCYSLTIVLTHRGKPAPPRTVSADFFPS